MPVSKAFIVRFFSDGGFRLEGPFPPLQVQGLIERRECQQWQRTGALLAIWGNDPIDPEVLQALSPSIDALVQQKAHARYRPLLSNHYRRHHRKHWHQN